MTAVRRYLDNTILSSYKECPRKYFLRHVKNWRGEGIALPLAFGLGWHAAMDIVWQYYHKCSLPELMELAAGAFDDTWEGEGLPRSLSMEELERYGARTPMVAREMLSAYVAKREKMLKESELIAAEQPFAVPLPLDKEGSGPDVWYAGRFDKVIRTTRLIPLEHKTTTEYKKDGGFRSQYVESWNLDSQIMGYIYGASLYYGEHVNEVWVDAALVHKQVHDAFRFIPVAHGWDILASWIEDTKEWVRRIQVDEAKFAAAGELAPGVFPKQQGSCQGKYGACPYVNICRATPNPDKLSEAPAGYAEEKWEPFEVLKLQQLLDKEKASASS